MARSTLDSMPGHYWALIFVIGFIAIDAMWFGVLRSAFGSKKGKRSGTRRGGSKGSKPFTGPKLILTRNSSMYFDEDGDLAHEFWEEKEGKLVRRTTGLRKQGVVDLPIPAINPDLNIVLQCMVKEEDAMSNHSAASGQNQNSNHFQESAAHAKAESQAPRPSGSNAKKQKAKKSRN